MVPFFPLHTYSLTWRLGEIYHFIDFRISPGEGEFLPHPNQERRELMWRPSESPRRDAGLGCGCEPQLPAPSAGNCGKRVPRSPALAERGCPSASPFVKNERFFCFRRYNPSVAHRSPGSRSWATSDLLKIPRTPHSQGSGRNREGRRPAIPKDSNFKSHPALFHVDIMTWKRIAHFPVVNLVSDIRWGGVKIEKSEQSQKRQRKGGGGRGDRNWDSTQPNSRLTATGKLLQSLVPVASHHHLLV